MDTRQTQAALAPMGSQRTLGVVQLDQGREDRPQTRHRHQDQPPVGQTQLQARLRVHRGERPCGEVHLIAPDELHQQREQVDALPVDLHTQSQIEPVAALALGDVHLPIADLGDPKVEALADLDPPALRREIGQCILHEVEPGLGVGALEPEAIGIRGLSGATKARCLEHADRRPFGFGLTLHLDEHPLLDAAQHRGTVARIHRGAAIFEVECRVMCPLGRTLDAPVATHAACRQIDATQAQTGNRHLRGAATSLGALGEVNRAPLEALPRRLLQRIHRLGRDHRGRSQDAGLPIIETGLERTAVAGVRIQIPGRRHRQQQKPRTVGLEDHAQPGIVSETPLQPPRERTRVAQDRAIDRAQMTAPGARDRGHDVRTGQGIQIGDARVATAPRDREQAHDALIFRTNEACLGVTEDIEILSFTIAAGEQLARLRRTHTRAPDPEVLLRVDEIEDPMGFFGRNARRTLDLIEPAL